MEILIVEDDENIASATREILYLNDYHVEICYSGILAVEFVQKNCYDLILLDVMLPGMDGFQVMEEISCKQVPVIFITAKQDIRDKLCGFSLGAEDYIVKPFNFMELLARVEVVLRRNKKIKSECTYGDISMNLSSHYITKNGVKVDLTPKEFELAAFFIRHQDLILDREMLFQSIWGGAYADKTRTIDNHIRILRRKLGWQDCLITVHKMGYKLIRRN